MGRLRNLAVTLALLAAAAVACAGCGGGSDEIAPKGAVYSYRIPEDFQKTKVIGSSTDSFSLTTAVASAKAKHRGVGITVGQIPSPVSVVNMAALRAARSEIDPPIRSSIVAQTGATVSAPMFAQVAGHPAVEWTATDADSGPFPELDFKAIVVIAGPKAVDIVCRWRRTAAERRLVLRACDALLASLHVKGGASTAAASTGSSSSVPQAASVTAVLQAVFAHPTPSQCATAMTPAYLAVTFGDLTHGERKVASTARKVCAIHQRQRSAMEPALREVTVHDLTIEGASATATLRGTNDYPIEVALTRVGGVWRLDAPGKASTGPGSGEEVAPQGSLYAYRIPSGFRPGHVAIGPVEVTGSAFSTAITSPKASGRGDGVAVAQSTSQLSVHDAAELRAQLPPFTRELRRVLQDAGVTLTSAPAATRVGDRPALRLTWVIEGTTRQTTIVFSTAVPLVVAVNCIWHGSPPEIAEIRRGCDAVLGSLRVK
jgi:hypothetical protein